MIKKIAFLFLIYDIINQEELWFKWLENVDKNKYSIYIHYKFDKPLKFFNNYKLLNCIETEYCKTSIVQAHNILIKEALKDETNYKFINLSQACIPLKNFNYIYDKLIMDNSGYFNITSGNNSSDELFPRCNELLNYFDKSIISKSSNWFILNRELSAMIIDNENNYLKYFENIYCPEEHYFITMVKLNKLDNMIIYNTEPINITTFTNWIYNTKYKFHDTEYNTIYYKKGLKNYPLISKNELVYLINNTECLFGRKFNVSCNVFSRRPIKKTEKILDFILEHIV